MTLLIIFALCTLSTTKVALQSRFGKKFMKTTDALVLFNALVFLSAAILFCTAIIGASLQTWLFSAAFAVFTVIFQLTYTKALSLGNVSLTVLFVNLSMLFPVIMSVIFYGESLTFIRIFGILLTVLSFIICVDIKEKNPISKKWLFLALSATLANACIGITQKIFGASVYHAQKDSFVACAYSIAFIITITIYALLILRKVGGGKLQKAPIFLISMSVGVVLAVFQWLNTYAISTIDASLLFPLSSGVTIIMSTLMGIILFRDKLSLKQGISIAIGIAAVVIMNL